MGVNLGCFLGGRKGLEHLHIAAKLTLFAGDTWILQGSPAHLHRIVRHPYLARLYECCTKRWSFPLIQSATARGSHLYVTCWSVCNRDQGFWSTESVLDHFIVPSWSLDFQRSKVKLQPRALDPLIFSSSEVTLMHWLAPQKASGHLYPLTCSVFSILAHVTLI